MKYFRMSYEEILYKRSYINLILLNRAIPSVKPFDEDDDSPMGKEKKTEHYDNANDLFMSFMG